MAINKNNSTFAMNFNWVKKNENNNTREMNKENLNKEYSIFYKFLLNL